MKQKMFTAVLCLLFVASVSGLAWSEELHEKGNTHHKNHAAIFVGYTQLQEEDEDGLTTGIDYEYRLTDLLGVGALFEYAGGDFDSFVWAVPVFIHPYAGLKLVVAPGFETEDGNSYFLVRTGVGYDIHLTKDITVTPQYNFDFVKEDTVSVYGVSVGFGF